MCALIHHYDGLVRYVRHHFNSRHFAQDVVHDVCIELMQNPPQQAVSNPLAYLRVVSRHRAIDLSRSDDARQKWVDLTAEPSETFFHTLDGAYLLDFQQNLQALINLIEALPTRQRQVFLLHRIHGVPQQEIADAMGISRNMVTQHFGRAMQAIANNWAPANGYGNLGKNGE